MRTISVSTDTFALIWALRKDREDNEDQILSRVLRAISRSDLSISQAGLLDARSGVSFRIGFEIFRTYKGVDYRAVAESQGWRLCNTDELFRTLNSLSASITAGNENAWVNWKYVSEDGRPRLLSELRPAIERRPKAPSNKKKQKGRRMSRTWRDDVVEAFRSLGGSAHLDQIYEEVRLIRKKRQATLPPSTNAIIRREIENNSSDSEAFQGRYDLFESLKGIGSGVWALKENA